MPELRWKHASLIPRWSHLVVVALGTGLSAPPVLADALPSSLRTCIAEADPAKRLMCFDRESARLLLAESAKTAAPEATGQAPQSTPRGAATGDQQHLSARVISVEHGGDDLVVHLDNGQVWEQSQPASAEVNLHVGDPVKIDREMGSWWLSASYGQTLQVRRKQ